MFRPLHGITNKEQASLQSFQSLQKNIGNKCDREVILHYCELTHCIQCQQKKLVHRREVHDAYIVHMYCSWRKGTLCLAGGIK